MENKRFWRIFRGGVVFAIGFEYLVGDMEVVVQPWRLPGLLLIALGLTGAIWQATRSVKPPEKPTA